MSDIRPPRAVTDAAAARHSERHETNDLDEAWEALRQAIWQDAPSFDPRRSIRHHRPLIEAAILQQAAREPGDIDCPVCQGSGVLHDITEVVEKAEAAGYTIMRPAVNLAALDEAER